MTERMTSDAWFSETFEEVAIYAIDAGLARQRHGHQSVISTAKYWNALHVDRPLLQEALARRIDSASEPVYFTGRSGSGKTTAILAATKYLETFGGHLNREFLFLRIDFKHDSHFKGLLHMTDTAEIAAELNLQMEIRVAEMVSAELQRRRITSTDVLVALVREQLIKGGWDVEPSSGSAEAGVAVKSLLLEESRKWESIGSVVRNKWNNSFAERILALVKDDPLGELGEGKVEALQNLEARDYLLAAELLLDRSKIVLILDNVDSIGEIAARDGLKRHVRVADKALSPIPLLVTMLRPENGLEVHDPVSGNSHVISVEDYEIEAQEFERQVTLRRLELAMAMHHEREGGAVPENVTRYIQNLVDLLREQPMLDGMLEAVGNHNKRWKLAQLCNFIYHLRSRAPGLVARIQRGDRLPQGSARCLMTHLGVHLGLKGSIDLSLFDFQGWIGAASNGTSPTEALAPYFVLSAANYAARGRRGGRFQTIDVLGHCRKLGIRDETTKAVLLQLSKRTDGLAMMESYSKYKESAEIADHHQHQLLPRGDYFLHSGFRKLSYLGGRAGENFHLDEQSEFLYGPDFMLHAVRTLAGVAQLELNAIAYALKARHVPDAIEWIRAYTGVHGLPPTGGKGQPKTLTLVLHESYHTYCIAAELEMGKSEIAAMKGALESVKREFLNALGSVTNLQAMTLQPNIDSHIGHWAGRQSWSSLGGVPPSPKHKRDRNA